MKAWFLLSLLGAFSNVQGEGEVEESTEDGLNLQEFQPIEEKLLNRIADEDDGPFERKIKKLVADYILATAIDSVANGTDNGEINGRAIYQGNYYPQAPQQQQPQVVYVYGTTPRSQNQRTQRTRRPGHHHHNRESSEEQRRRTPAPPQQPIYVQQPQPSYPYPQQQPPYNPQYQPQQPQQPPYNPQYPQQPQQPQQPSYNPQYPQQSQPAYQPQVPQDSLTGPVNASTVPAQSPSYPQQSQPQYQPQAPQYQQQQPAAPAPPVQVVYLEPTTSAPTGPVTTRRPRPSQEHVFNQVNKILDNVAKGNITGIVDQSLTINTPMPTQMLVNGILNTIFCSPINRFLGRCRG